MRASESSCVKGDKSLKKLVWQKAMRSHGRKYNDEAASTNGLTRRVVCNGGSNGGSHLRIPSADPIWGPAASLLNHWEAHVRTPTSPRKRAGHNNSEASLLYCIFGFLLFRVWLCDVHETIHILFFRFVSLVCIFSTDVWLSSLYNS